MPDRAAAGEIPPGEDESSTSPAEAGDSTPRPGRVLGIDPGTVRLGIAITDPDRLVATPHSTIPAGRGAVAAVVHLMQYCGATAVVVGLPKSLRGGDTDSTRMARRLAADLSAAGITVHLHDERLTSVQADRALRVPGVSGTSNRKSGSINKNRARKNRAEGVKDQIAASLLLQAWLDTGAARRRRQTP
ncbi:Holliday junction resolvase RuvX [Euzebya tangerina]|uniref:Holliday junction resolvase RuvX n=1 Tax=Euzebya tangerina TaxID=591198 RepID=UPI00196B73C9|nr:Holliday junction resolvase RuvX [Euzebya tangerina]